jgi:hypothetical protein
MVFGFLVGNGRGELRRHTVESWFFGGWRGCGWLQVADVRFPPPFFHFWWMPPKGDGPCRMGMEEVAMKPVHPHQWASGASCLLLLSKGTKVGLSSSLPDQVTEMGLAGHQHRKASLVTPISLSSPYDTCSKTTWVRSSLKIERAPAPTSGYPLHLFPFHVLDLCFFFCATEQPSANSGGRRMPSTALVHLCASLQIGHLPPPLSSHHNHSHPTSPVRKVKVASQINFKPVEHAPAVSTFPPPLPT